MKQSSNKIIIFLHNFWQKLWGENIPDFDYDSASDDFYEKMEQQKNHKRKKESLKVRRVLVCITLLISVYLLGCLSVFGFKNLVKSNKFFACLGKDVCIYQGAKVKNRPSFMPNTIQLDNGDIYIYDNACHITYLWYLEILDKFDIYNSRIKNILFKPITKPLQVISEKLNNKYGKRTSQIYNKHDNKFIKVKNYRLNRYIRPIDIPRSYLIKDSKNNVYYYNYESETDKYNFKENKFELVNIPIFDSKFYILTPYKNKYLVLSNNSDYLNSNNTGRLTEYEQLYLLNPDTFELELFPNFVQQPKYHPLKEDIIKLKNEKLIIPLRRRNKIYFNGYTNFTYEPEWDHIEIYDPETNQFFAEYNTKVLKDNFFQIDLQNNDILFINKNGCYIFKNDKNRFEEADINTQQKAKNFVDIVNNTLQYELHLNLEDRITEKVKYLKLSPTSYLLTCGDELITSNSEVCKKTVLVDYEGVSAQGGPKFVNNHQYAAFEKIDDNRYMVIGGMNHELHKNHIPNKRVQIIATTKKERK